MKDYRWLIWLGIALTVGAGLWFFHKILLYIVIALVLSLVGRPVTIFLKKFRIASWRLPDGMAATLTVLMMYSVLGLFFYFFIPVLIAQLQSLTKIDLNQIAINLEQPLRPLRKLAIKYEMLERRETFWEHAQAQLTNFVKDVEVSNILNSAVRLAGDTFIALFAVTFITFFLLKERSLAHRFILSVTPDGYENRISNVIQHSKKLLSRYFIGVLVEQVVVGFTLWLGLTLMGAQNALLIAFVAGLVNIIPYVGPIIGLSFSLIMILAGYAHLDFYTYAGPLMLKTFILFNVVHLIDNALLQPWIYSSSVKAHPLEIFILILAAGMAFGVPGLLLAIPVYTLFRVFAREFLSQFEIVQAITKNLTFTEEKPKKRRPRPASPESSTDVPIRVEVTQPKEEYNI